MRPAAPPQPVTPPSPPALELWRPPRPPLQGAVTKTFDHLLVCCPRLAGVTVVGELPAPHLFIQLQLQVLAQSMAGVRWLEGINGTVVAN